MKFAASILILAALAVASPSVSHAQVRVHIDVGLNHRGYGYHSYVNRYPRAHRVERCYGYSRYRCYPSEAVIVRRHVRPAPVVIVRPHYRKVHRHHR